MEKYKIASLISVGFLLIAAVLIVVSLAGKDWDVISMDIKVAPLTKFYSKLKNLPGGSGIDQMMEEYFPGMKGTDQFPNNDMVQMFSKLEINIKVKIGLKEACLVTGIDGVPDKFSGMGMSKYMPKYCRKLSWLKDELDDSMDTYQRMATFDEYKNAFRPVNKLVKELNKAMSAMSAAFICMVVALAFIVVALLTSALKTPCVKLPRKGCLTWATIVLCIGALAACVAGVVFVHKDVTLKHEYEVFSDEMVRYLSIIPEIKSQLDIAKELEKLFPIHEKKGISFGLACGGAVILLFVVLLNVFENFVARRKADDAYSMGLISRPDGYKRAESM